MPAVGGPIIDLNLLGRPMSVAEDSEVTIQLGGDNNDVLMNGDGTGRLIKTLMPWTADGITIKNDHEKEDHEFVQNSANRRTFGAITIGLASGAVLQGDGQIVGEIAASSKNATVAFSLKGTGSLTQQ